MSAEDRLRDVLRSEATTIVPAGDGLARIRERVERRRRARLWLLPSAAVATVGVAAAFFLLSPDGGRAPQSLDQATPSATASPSAQPSISPTPVAPSTLPGDWTGPAYWPFATAADAQAQPDPPPAWAQDPLEVGTRLVRDVLKLTDVTVAQTCASCEALQLTVGGKDVGTIQLGHYTVHDTRVFTVAGIGGTDLTITSPPAGTAVSSPTRVTGRVQGVDENVRLRLVTEDGSAVSEGSAPAGSAVPWTANLSWTARDWDSGAILATTGNNLDGAINRVALSPLRSSTATATSSFAGLVDGHVSLLDSATGKVVRQLTYPPKGMSDTALSWSAGTLAWVRTGGASACVNELDRLDNGKASTVVSSTRVRYGWPVLSPSADWLAWVETPCSSESGGEIVVTVNGTENRRLAIPSGSVANLFDITDDGTLLLSTNDGQPTGPGVIAILPREATTLDGRLLPLHPAAECNLASGAAFDGSAPVAFESCSSSVVRLVRFTDKGARKSVDPAFRDEPPNSVSVRDGEVLVWLFGGDGVGRIARYDAGRTTTLVKNDGAGCTSVGDLKGCVFAPDW